MDDKLFNEFIKSHDLISYINEHKDLYMKYITHNDLILIFEGMDKTDYTQCGCKRWLNLEYLLNEVINRKKENSSLELKSVKIVKILETFPPQNKYYMNFS